MASPSLRTSSLSPRPAAWLAAALLLLSSLAAYVVPPGTAQTESSVQVRLIDPETPPVVDIEKVVKIRVDNTADSTSSPFTLTLYHLKKDRVNLNQGNCTNAGQIDSVGQGTPTQTQNLGLGPKSSVTYLFCWKPSRPQNGTGSILAIVADLVGQEKHRMQVPVFVAEPKFVTRKGWNDTREAKLVTETCTTKGVNRNSCKVLPGQILSFEVGFTNQGNYADTYVAQFQDEGKRLEDPVSKLKWNVSFAPETVVTNPNDTRSLRMVVEVAKNGTTVQAGKEYNFNETDLYVRGYSKLDPKVAHRTEFPRLVVGQLFKVNVTSHERFHNNSTGTPLQYDIRVRNDGNGEDRIHYRYLPQESTINSTWRPVWTRENVTIKPWEAINNSFTVVPPKNATKGRYFMTVEVSSLKDKDAGPNSVRKLHLVGDVDQDYALSGGISSPLDRRVPDDPTSFEITLENDGNGPDNLTLRLEGQLPQWRTELSKRKVRLDAFQSTTVFLNVTPPPNTRAGTTLHLFVNATSEGPKDRAEEHRPNVSVRTKVEVLKGPNFKMSQRHAADKLYVDPGKSATFELDFTNTGNIEQNVSLSFPGLDPLWGASVTPDVIRFTPLESRTARVTLTAPPGARIGDSTTLIVRAVSREDEARYRTLDVAAHVSGPDLFVGSVNVNPGKAYAGDPTNVTVLVGNLGNRAPSANVTLRISASPGAFEIPIQDVTLSATSLPGGARRTVSVPWNTTGIEGPVTIRAVLDPGGAITEINELNNNVTVSSSIRRFDLHVSPALGLPARPGQTLGYLEPPNAFVVENRGNAPETLRILIESEHGWGKDERTLVLRPGDSQVFGVSLAVPERPGIARDILRFSVIAVDRNDYRIATSATTTLIDDDPPRIEGAIARPAAAKLFDAVNLSVRVLDATGVASVKLVLQDPLNGTSEASMTRGKDDAYHHLVRPNLVGTYKVYVEAVDVSEKQNRNTTRFTPITFTVSPDSAPVIALEGVDFGVVRSGTPLRLRVTDPLGVAKVSYEAGGLRFPLESPYAIDTSAWKEGEVEFVVHAENTYGARSKATFTVTVDNTPPRITKYEISPAKPRANQEVTVRITTSDQVQGVDVVVRRGADDVDRLEGQRQGPGLFTVKFTPGAGAYDLDVLAKDAAGNTNVERGYVQFTAKSGLFAPGLEIAAALLAVAAAALLATARRRR